MGIHFRAAGCAVRLVPLRAFELEGHCTGVCILY